MKSKFLLLSILFASAVSAQFVITPNAQFSIAGNIPLTLQNINLVNDGVFAAGNSLVTFTGDAASSISGSRPIQFYGLEINKTSNSSVLLQQPIGVTQRILFTAGFLNLNGFDTDLGSTGRVDGEQENSRVIGSNGGEILFSTILDAPDGSNPGNLGAVITSAQNLGNVTIKRGHQAQATGVAGNSILRYYNIIPANNSSLNATIRINYFDTELNGLSENSLVLFKRDTAPDWAALGFTSKNASTNFVEKTGINSFSTFTLSASDDVLPVHFILFNARCEENKVALTWKTAQEQNSSHFAIEKSLGGIRWITIGHLPAAGITAIEKNYLYTDNNPVQNAYYRIAQYDLDGRVQYSGTLRSTNCGVANALNVWPNPFHETVFINIIADNKSQAVIKVFDGRGALVKIQKETVLQGSNQFNVDVRSLTNGTYSFYIDWNNGQMKKKIQVVRQ